MQATCSRRVCSAVGRWQRTANADSAAGACGSAAARAGSASQQRRSLSTRPGPHRSEIFELEHADDVPELLALLEDTKREGILSQWVHVPMRCGAALEPLEKAGFAYHHACGTVGVLCKWLGDGVSKVPEYATHRVGVAGLVVNDDGKVLLVTEKRGKFWKLPGGHADLGEDIYATAVREVLEETGVRCEFQHLLALRQSHGLSHGRSDLYFICLLRPLSTEIVKCDEEIAAADWFPVSKLAESPSELNRCVAELFEEGSFLPISHVRQTHAITKAPTSFYYSKA